MPGAVTGSLWIAVVAGWVSVAVSGAAASVVAAGAEAVSGPPRHNSSSNWTGSLAARGNGIVRWIGNVVRNGSLEKIIVGIEIS